MTAIDVDQEQQATHQLSVWGSASTTNHAVGQTGATIDSTGWAATAKGLSGAWGKRG